MSRPRLEPCARCRSKPRLKKLGQRTFWYTCKGSGCTVTGSDRSDKWAAAYAWNREQGGGRP